MLIGMKRTRIEMVMTGYDGSTMTNSNDFFFEV
jgi:hypothetical protein